MTVEQICSRRRQRLLQALQPGEIALVPAAQLQLRNGDVHHAFRQSSDLFYLTEFPEPDALLLLHRAEDGDRQLLFCKSKDPLKERWDGPIAGPERAMRDYGLPAALPLSAMEQQLPALLSGAGKLLYSLTTPGAAGRVRALLSSVPSVAGVPHGNLDTSLHEMRLIKDETEIDRMRASVAIADAAHRRLMAAVRPGMMEYELEAECLYEFARRGAAGPAYSTIVGAGNNACVLHYISNNTRIADGDLVLVDAGCEYRGYASDITRTFPANGRFTAEQRALYELVLRAQHSAIAAMIPGVPCDEPQQAAVRTIAEGLVELGILAGPVEQVLADGSWQAYYMHRVGHWLGMDVHDVGAVEIDGQPRPLQAGMVMTVEPGIYIDADSRAPKQWRGIGIRIEDDVLVTAKGAEALTPAPPKSVDEVEALAGADARA